MASISCFRWKALIIKIVVVWIWTMWNSFPWIIFSIIYAFQVKQNQFRKLKLFVIYHTYSQRTENLPSLQPFDIFVVWDFDMKMPSECNVILITADSLIKWHFYQLFIKTCGCWLNYCLNKKSINYFINIETGVNFNNWKWELYLKLETFYYYKVDLISNLDGKAAT